MAVFDNLSKGVVSRRWGSLVAAGLLSFTLYGCGSSDSTSPTPPPPPPVVIDVAAVIAAAVANPANDAAVNSSAPFAVMNDTGLAAVTVNGAPVVNFTVFSDGAVKTGLTTGSSTGPNVVTFLIAKLGTTGSPDEWFNYVYRKRTGAAGTPVAGTDVIQATHDSTGTLVYNPAGYYTYTFSTDITNPDDPKNLQKVVYEPGRTHRIALQLRYTNAAGELISVNPYFDFTIGADGKSVAVTNPTNTRQVTDIRSCNTCHEKLMPHSRPRVDTQACVLCHNPSTTDEQTGNVVDQVTMVHKIHMGHKLPSVIAGGSYKIQDSDFSEAAFPQDIRNCTKCHNGDESPAAGVAFTTPQGNNWFNKPNRVACGSCHDGIDFATSTGTTLAQAAAIAEGAADPGGNVHTSGAFGLTDDGACVLCHGADKGLAVKLVHRTNFVTPNNPDVPVGLTQFKFELGSVVIGSDMKPTFKFRFLKDGAAVTFNPYVDADSVMLPGFSVPPSNRSNGYALTLYLAYSLDGASDFTTTASASFDSLWKAGAWTRDADGWYTATTSHVVPAGAKMITGAIYGGLVVGSDPATGLYIPAYFVQKLATGVSGNAARRAVVSNAKCNACHDVLGTNPNFHWGARNDATACAICHNPGRANNGWAVGVSSFVHALHAASIREKPFTWHYKAGVFEPAKIGYPGNIGNCSSCHLDNTINFGASASAAAVPNMLLNTTASSTIVDNGSNSPWAEVGVNYGAAGADTNLVNSPITSACTSCHDNDLAISHIRSQGGSFYEARSVADTKQPEACLLCHGPGKIADIKVMHGQ
ncbi:MAG: OmcA/MtrC family decaheme c-type cytochrome [Burkholderiaceae bacterium]|nr:OmcA/MtrC family decaheme c-type cytochrome [Burkholderiaceae bacterium]